MTPETYDWLAGISGYVFWAAAIFGVVTWAVLRARAIGRAEGWNQCCDESESRADDPAIIDEVNARWEATIRSHVMPILEQRDAAKHLPLHALKAESLLRLLQTTERPLPKP